MQNLTRFVGFSNESVLIQALKNGDELAVEYWFKKYRLTLTKIALSKVPNSTVAAEIVQETFIDCLQTLNLFKGQSSLLTWMQSVMRHEIADYYRKRYAKKVIQTIPLSDLLLEQSYKDAASSAELVTVVLKRMIKKNRELLLKKYVDCKKVKDIALETGASVKAVESDLFRARQEFKTLWLELGVEYGGR
ncbi:MAG TPA: sigma-70 family RNA polymerase sigma factor [Candidatus Woesebacteria bacterium]|jgi:RNA polymerase sigma-70 factor (ECF subfamily)|nr:sigma-70 family RNA polymerase sigma factor [Candidatus Woesebacteria bacterium]